VAAACILSKNNTPTTGLHNPINKKFIDKFKLESAVNKTISWLDASQEVLKEDYKLKQKVLEAIVK